MPIDLSTIKSKAAAQLTTSNILAAIGVVLAVIIGWDVLVRRYNAFLAAAPWLPTLVVGVLSLLFSALLGYLLLLAIRFLLDLVYFGPLNRLNTLEREANEKLSKLIDLEREAHEKIRNLAGQSWCHSAISSILAGEWTPLQGRRLDELTVFVKGTTDGPMKEGALEVLKEMPDPRGLIKTKPLPSFE